MKLTLQTWHTINTCEPIMCFKPFQRYFIPLIYFTNNYCKDKQKLKAWVYPDSNFAALATTQTLKSKECGVGSKASEAFTQIALSL